MVSNLLFGWFTKGHCDVSGLDNLIMVVELCATAIVGLLLAGPVMTLISVVKKKLKF